MNILSLFPKTLYDTKMSPGRTLYLNHVGKSHKLVWSGLGWDNWTDDVDSLLNISNLERVNDCTFDAIVVYKGEGLVGLCDTHQPKFTIFNEAHDNEAVDKELKANCADVVVFHHQGDAEQFINRTDHSFGEGDVYCWMHAAPEVPYTPWEDRRETITTGCIAESIYPVRARANKAAWSVEGINHREIPHPGYRLNSRVHVVGQYASYLKTLANSKISICCSSIYRYPLAKLIESAMCGCVVATDLPICDNFERLLWPHCIQLDAEMSHEDMVDAISDYDDGELKAMGEESRAIAQTYFSYDNWAACLISAIKDHC